MVWLFKQLELRYTPWVESMFNHRRAMVEKQLKHLEMIQGVINRLASNSFQMKGWSVVLVSALFALSAPGGNIHFIYLAYFPAIMFWLLDGYFLWQERLFRDLYNEVRETAEDAVDFSMNTSEFSNVSWNSSWPGAAFSKTLLIFHGVLFASIVCVMVISLVMSA